MRIIFTPVIFLLFVNNIFAVNPQDILNAIDKNKNFGTIYYTAKMEIKINNETRTKSMKVWAIGDQKALVEFTNPEDQGVKYLKINKELWIYFPSEQEVVKISGHMLKEGMMGSDISYEDALESDALYKKYSSSFLAEELIGNYNCYVLELKAVVKNAPYYKRKIWVDKNLYIPIKEELYTKGDKVLKVSNILEIKKIGGRYFPVKIEMINMLRKNSKTIFEMQEIKLDIKLADDIFTMRNLQK
jgi:outer membrane lipoprotein-sorting protein